MAAGTKLVLVFDVEGSDTTTTFSFNYAKPGATENAVKALARAMIANKTLWEKQPAAIKSAKTVTTSDNEYDVSGLDISSPSTQATYANPEPDPNAQLLRSWKR